MGKQWRSLEIIPTALEILCSMEEMCLANFRRLSIVTPKYLALLLMRINELFNERSIVGGGLLSLGEMIRALDLKGLTVILFLNRAVLKYCQGLCS